ncbi:hypothetical protein B0T11DRAFT_272771 [Plectosphaerella cucumerina]|uniref:Uncharacterized protein n=1 Tax=Plectosphaerella cucumerina TaxID=40658 RepID=A0A8K0X9S3_9PEZI|nr:hypothetical protein B0T11DRAFT_272771 [Plectosphaerella cucumerina]
MEQFRGSGVPIRGLARLVRRASMCGCMNDGGQVETGVGVAGRRGTAGRWNVERGKGGHERDGRKGNTTALNLFLKRAAWPNHRWQCDGRWTMERESRLQVFGLLDSAWSRGLCIAFAAWCSGERNATRSGPRATSQSLPFASPNGFHPFLAPTTACSSRSGCALQRERGQETAHATQSVLLLQRRGTCPRHTTEAVNHGHAAKHSMPGVSGREMGVGLTR